jgi:hypothetical protein
VTLGKTSHLRYTGHYATFHGKLAIGKKLYASPGQSSPLFPAVAVRILLDWLEYRVTTRATTLCLWIFCVSNGVVITLPRYILFMVDVCIVAGLPNADLLCFNFSNDTSHQTHFFLVSKTSTFQVVVGLKRSRRGTIIVIVAHDYTLLSFYMRSCGKAAAATVVAGMMFREPSCMYLAR